MIKIIDDFLDNETAESVFNIVDNITDWNRIIYPSNTEQKTKELFNENKFTYKYSQIEDKGVINNIYKKSNLDEKLIGYFVKRNQIINSIFISKYEKGDFLSPHTDNTEGKNFTFIYNLTKNPKPHFGGVLHIIDNGEIVQSITPKFNRLIIFPVNLNIKHFVSEVVAENYKRYAITGWMSEIDFKMKDKLSIL